MRDLLSYAETALRRTRKRLAHAVREEMECDSPRALARLRRQRRAATRRENEARWTLEALSMGDA